MQRIWTNTQKHFDQWLLLNYVQPETEEYELMRHQFGLGEDDEYAQEYKEFLLYIKNKSQKKDNECGTCTVSLRNSLSDIKDELKDFRADEINFIGDITEDLAERLSDNFDCVKIEKDSNFLNGHEYCDGDNHYKIIKA